MICCISRKVMWLIKNKLQKFFKLKIVPVTIKKYKIIFLTYRKGLLTQILRAFLCLSLFCLLFSSSNRSPEQQDMIGTIGTRTQSIPRCLLGPFGIIWKILSPLRKLEKFWSYLGHMEPFELISDHFRPILTILDHFGPVCTNWE